MFSKRNFTLYISTGHGVTTAVNGHRDLGDWVKQENMNKSSDNEPEVVEGLRKQEELKLANDDFIGQCSARFTYSNLSHMGKFKANLIESHHAMPIYVG